MYNNQSSGNRRYSKTSKGYYGKNTRNRGYGKSNWKNKNRRSFRQSIDRSLYVSKAVDSENSSSYVEQRSFSDFNLFDILTKNIVNRKYKNPTKIQNQTIPEVLSGRDILGIGCTGSGKTAAFLIPMIDKVLRNSQEKVLIITPTRELAVQISTEFKKFTYNTGLGIVVVIGGASMRDQVRILKSNPQFVVATPGRLIDLEKRKFINLKNFTNVVLDEVDQMLAMGFVEDIKQLISKLSTQRQSLFFSATLSQKEETLANTLLSNPVKVEPDKQSPLKSIDQDIIKIQNKEQKIQVLHDLLLKDEFHKVLVFSGTKINADNVSRELRKRGVRVDSLHGNKSQSMRSRVLSTFRDNKIDVLVATDVAARGIDIPNISHVINYDEPANYNDYIHRIGRTGRIGKKGYALTFVLSKGR